MAAQSAQTSESLKASHTSPTSCFVACRRPKRGKSPAEMKQALGWTLDALGRDVINDDPAICRALPERIGAARKADRALLRRRPAICHRALRRFWSI
jgi:hypothetical protein